MKNKMANLVDNLGLVDLGLVDLGMVVDLGNLDFQNM